MTPTSLNAKLITEGNDNAVQAFMQQLTSEEKLFVAKHALASADFNPSNFVVNPASVQELRNLRNSYRIKEAEAQLDAAMTGNKENARALLVLSGYIECINYLISVAEDNVLPQPTDE